MHMDNAYLQQQPADTPSVPGCPADQPRPATRISEREPQSFELPDPLSAALNALSEREDAPLFITLLAAFKTLLARYTGASDIVVGTGDVNDSPADLEAPAGHFSDTLVLHTDLPGMLTFQELLRRICEMAREAYTQPKPAFEALLEELQSTNDLEHSPLFLARFAMQDTPLASLDLADVARRSVNLAHGPARFNLSLSIAKRGQSLVGAIRYSTELFDETMVGQMLRQYRVLLEQIVVQPAQRAATLTLLTPADRRQLLYDWNATQAPFPHDHCFQHLFEAQVARTPDAIALVFARPTPSDAAHCLTYRDLNTRANRLAHRLRARGVRAETLVGLCVERSLAMVVALLGILKAGGAYLPLDPRYPRARLHFMLADAQVRLVVTQPHLAAQVQADGVDLIDLGRATAPATAATNPVRTTSAANLAYVIYTSGSTGTPKGVLVTHRGLCNLADAQIRTFNITSDLSILQFSSISFDASIFEIVMALRSGAKLCLTTQEALLPGPALIELIRDEAITNITLPPSVLAHFPDEKLPSLKTIIVAGEACSAELAARWASGRRFFNAYGPTETTVWASVAPYIDDDCILTIGRPIANTQMYILDDQLQPVPIGMPGEVYIGGVGLARGYLNRPDLTAERFVPNPFVDERRAPNDEGPDPSCVLHPASSDRLYKSGDRARYLPDGQIAFLGRGDQQVKVRGFRIELSEIEAALRRHQAVREAVVLARADRPGAQRLVAYVVTTNAERRTPTDMDPDPSSVLRPAAFVQEVRASLHQHLPDYMIPAVFVLLDALPLTANGKIDRRSLPVPDPARSDQAAAFVPPRTLIEERLAQIWTEILGLERVGIHDNFFELGGHSLLITQLASRVRAVFQIELPLRHIFSTPTLAGLAESIQHIEVDRQAKPPQEFSLIHPVPRTGSIPLSFSQERVWFLNELEPGSIAYNTQLTIDFKGQLNIAALEQALTEIVRRHEILRTSFPAVAGRPVQIIHPPYHVTLPITDLRGISENEQGLAVTTLLSEEFQQSFETTRIPLVRWTLLKLSKDHHLLIQVEHHFVHDGWSLAVLLREMKTLYEAFCAGKPSPLPELPVQFADFAIWQRQWLQGEVLEEQVAYWTKQLHGMPAMLELPTDRPRPKAQSFKGAVQWLEIPVDLYQSLRVLSHSEGVTLFMTMLAAFVVLLHRYTGQADIVVGSGIANRRLRESEGLIGMIINTVVLRTDISGNPTFRELLKRVRDISLGAYAHQDLPFDKLVDVLRPERNMSYSPLFQVSFSFHDSPIPALVFPNLSGTIEYRNNGSAKFDLNVIAIPRVEQLAGSGQKSGFDTLTMVWEYSTALFDETTVQRMLHQYRMLLEQIVAQPAQRAATLTLLTPADRRQLLYAWNATQAPFPHDHGLQHLFEAQVARTPDAVALVFARSTPSDAAHCLTYRDLNTRANRLAHRLRARGVRAETLVGLCVERSLAMVVALLGILKAGGAYLPLDPRYPRARLHFMLADAQVRLVVTQPHLAAQVQADGVELIDLERATAPETAATNPVGTASAANLAYVIYTSGSTGTPKGVLVAHRGLCNVIQESIRTFNIRADSRVLQLSSLSFDASVLEIFTALLAGGSVYLMDRDISLSASGLVQLLDNCAISVIALPPSLLDVLPVVDLPALQTIIVGGERCSPGTVAVWSPGRRFFNAYAPTEATIYCTVLECTEVSPHGPAIGRPIANMQMYILDDQFEPVPIGMPGEVYIGGVGLARGYLNRPDLTAERFVPNPFVDEGRTPNDETAARPVALRPAPSDRLYKSGDWARYLPDGQIAFLGRGDQQVKVRGFRIELGEIEAALRRHQAVREAVVLARADRSGAQRLVAYVVTTNAERRTPTDMDPDPSSVLRPAAFVQEVRASLHQHLPDYMVPAVFVLLDALPLTANGKIDRRALPVPDPARSDQAAAFVSPRTPAEQVLAEIWAQVLGVDRVGIHDNFFTLGGDSILSIQIIARANQRGLQITTKQLFEHQTIAGLAAMDGTSSLAQTEQRPVTGTIPLTPIQRWFFEQNLPEPQQWNQAMLLETKRPLSPVQLAQAIRYLLAHHDALRLRFVRTGDLWQQWNADVDGQVPFTWADLSMLPDAAHGAAIETASAELQTSLDLTTGPLLRAVLFDLGPQKPGRLLLIIHHLAIDGVSWRILLEDLQAVYQQLSQSEAPMLPPKTTSFKRWAEQLALYAQSTALHQELAYWRTGACDGGAAMPADYAGGVNSEASARIVAAALSPEETQLLLQEVPAIYHTQINDVLLTALAQTFARWTGARTLRVDLEGHGREDLFEQIDVSRTISWFTALFPILLNLGEADNQGEMLKAIKEQLRRVPNHGLGYGLLRYLSADEAVVAQLGAIPRADVSFNYLGQFDQMLADSLLFGLADESSGPPHSPHGLRRYLLDISGSVVRGQLHMRWRYSEHIHRRDTVERLAQEFIEALRSIIAHCQSPEAGGYTPSDFPDAGFTQEELDRLFASQRL
jgi:amino acid adenylation domain-containing protein/non-ribosomal peptide synthase protein (TIGR01720 family)